MNWDTLDISLAKTPYGYETWISKQQTGFCGTRLQVSYYKGLNREQAKCPNCGRVETAAPLSMCPSEDRTKLLLGTTEELEAWISKN